MTDQSIPLNKRCRQCDTVKPFWQFTKDKSKKDGLRSRCKACDRVYVTAQIAADANETKIITITEKYCPLCRQTKPVSEFYRRRDRPSGYANKCKACRNAYHASYIKTESGRRSVKESSRIYWQKYGKRYYQSEKGKAVQRKAQGKYRQTDHGKRKIRDTFLRSKYGISLAEYEAMFAAQKGRCAICDSDGDGKKLHLDHCHRTGKVRGFLCNGCNGGIGLFREDVARLQNAVEYLKRHG